MKLRRLYGTAAEVWARSYVRKNMAALSQQMHSLSPEQMKTCLIGLDVTVRRRTNRPAADFLA